jgi:dihydroxyacetone kinase-like predicted kinase
MLKLTKQLINKDSAFMTIFYGEEVTEKQANRVTAMIKEKYGDKLEITLVNGGQPVYYYIISVE